MSEFITALVTGGAGYLVGHICSGAGGSRAHLAALSHLRSGGPSVTPSCG